MRLSSAGFSQQSPQGEKKCLNSELWHACAGPLVSLPAVGSRVVYFPQGHSEQVAASTNREVDSHIPSYPSLNPQLICQLHNVTMHADVETDEVYAQLTLQPLTPEEQKEASFLPIDMGAPSKQPTNYFCKTLTASDTSTHGGFSVPRRSAEKVFPPLDYSQQPPCQELIARDLHENEWKFRHIFRGQPKRHLLTTGWSVFVSAKRLVAGDSIIFIWNENNELFLGIRRASRPQTVMPSSVLSSDSMHLGLLAAAAHAAATNSRFTIFYNPRASPSDFVIPLVKYIKAVYHTCVSVGMRFRMLFETEESSVRRYMGTITSTSDFDPVRWPNSHWRSVKVGWDESMAGERQPRVSLWEVEPLTTFPMYPLQFPLRLKRPWPQGLPILNGMKGDDMAMNTPVMWLHDGGMHSINFQGFGDTSWMQPRIDVPMFGTQTDAYQAQALSSLLQLQQAHGVTTRPAGLSHSHLLQQAQAQVMAQPHIIQQQLQHQNSFNSIEQLGISQQVSNVSSFMNNQLGFSSQAISCTDPKVNPSTNAVSNPFHSLMGAVPQNESSHLLAITRSSSLLSPTGWPPKRVAVDPVRISQSSLSLPRRECCIDQEGNNDHLLFGVNIDSPVLVISNGMPTLGGIGSDCESTNVPFVSSNYMSNIGNDFSLNPVSGCIDEAENLQTFENVGQDGLHNNFVKVYKSGSFGRTVNISKFNSYHELRSELARMFGLEGLLENPLRSSWQLVFVDRENDVLLLGDDPWPEFVSSVWCIKILSPQEVQEMGKQGLELLKSVSKLSNGICSESRNGMTCISTLDY